MWLIFELFIAFVALAIFWAGLKIWAFIISVLVILGVIFAHYGWALSFI